MGTQKIVAIIIYISSFILVVSSAGQGQNLNTVSANSILENISNGKDIQLSDSVIIGDLDFSKLNKTNLKFVPKYTILNPECFVENEAKEENTIVIDSKIEITNSIFENDVDFSSNEFKKNLDFQGTEFNGNTNFNEALFRYPVKFYNAKFYGNADFRCTRFGGTADFINTTFYSQAHFRRAELESFSLFSNTNFYQLVRFNATKFNGPYSDFRGAIFRNDAIFEFATFVNKVDFSYANFSNPVSFFNTKFYIVSFDHTNFTEFSLNEADFKTINIRWSDLKNVNLDEITFLKLIKNFKEIGQYVDSDDAYFEYNEKYNEHNISFLAWITSGYGVRPIFTIIFGILIILIFTLIYGIIGNVTFTKAFCYSVDSFVSAQSGDWIPPDGIIRIFHVIERLIGLLIISLFIVTLANVMIRL